MFFPPSFGLGNSCQNNRGWGEMSRGTFCPTLVLNGILEKDICQFHEE
jgi:hypothetical protein